MNRNKPKTPKRKLIITFRCVKCGKIYPFNWTYRLATILQDPKKLIHHEIKKKIYNIKCSNCDIRYDVVRVELYKKIDGELKLIYEENVDKSCYKPAEYYNIKFGSKGSGIGASIPQTCINEEPKRMIRDRTCPACGHGYTGSPICPMKHLHKTSKKSLSHRLSLPKDAAEKEFLKNSHSKHVPIEED